MMDKDAKSELVTVTGVIISVVATLCVGALFVAGTVKIINSMFGAH